ncbi:MAG: alcohol dehydrogenase catalytic domain-containing protein, partial [Myxococcales bacterium]
MTNTQLAEVPRSTPSHMRAAVLTAARQFSLQNVAVPTPGPKQVRLKLEGCGICGSNLPPWEGREWFKYPFGPGSPGHEGWGRVDAVGSEVRVFYRGCALGEELFELGELMEAGAAVR